MKTIHIVMLEASKLDAMRSQSRNWYALKWGYQIANHIKDVIDIAHNSSHVDPLDKKAVY